MGTNTTRTWLGALVVAIGVTGALGACSDDDDTASTGEDPPGAEADLAAACAAEIGVNDALGSLPFPEGNEATEEQKSAIVAAFGPVDAALDELAGAYPDAPPVVTEAIDGLRELGESGDPSLLGDPAFVDVQTHFYDVCEDDAHLTFNAVDYAYEGPDEVPAAGQYRIRFSNEGSEVHEMVMFRRVDGETRPLEQLLALPEAEVESSLTFTNAAFAAPGEVQYLSGSDLAAGEYVLVCFVPVGTLTPEDFDPEAESPPHFTQGMTHELSVE